jgi:site-specific DNA recombinase
MNVVQIMLQNEIYIGNATHYKEISVSFKSKIRQPQSKDKWVTIEGGHEPLIDKETWGIVQDKAGRRVNFGASHEPNIFAIIACCADCGRSMGLTPKQIDFKTKRRTQRRYLQCSTNRVYGKTRCTLHNTNYQKLCEMVLDDIKAFSKLALEHSDELLLRLTESSDKKKLKELEQTKKELAKTKQRLNDLELLLQGFLNRMFLLK